jgi:multidrug transporter EmrE-like cation transporter
MLWQSPIAGVAGLALIVAGVVVINLFSPASTPAQ